jgi:acyl dehydratase
VRIFDRPEDLAGAVGERLGESGWHRIDQDRVTAFADATGDHQWIHVDPARAAASPFGGPVAHGFLTLSLLVPMLDEVVSVRGVGLVVNQGLDRLRFTAPVPVGGTLRLLVDLESVRRYASRGITEVAYGLTAELAGSRRPAYTTTLRTHLHDG